MTGGWSVRLCTLLLAGVLLLPGCESPGSLIGPEPTEEPTPFTLPLEIAFTPRTAGQGQQLEARLKGISSHFDQTTTLDLGPGITVHDLQVVSAGELELRIEVAADAAPGYRALTVVTGDEEARLEQAVLVQTGAILSVEPAIAQRGETLDVRLEVVDIPLEQSYTWASFGQGTTTKSFTVIDETHAVARIQVATDAESGLRDISVENGPTRVMGADGFSIDRGLIAIHFEPKEVKQGEVVAFTIEGYGTHFAPGKTVLDLGLGVQSDWDDKADFVVESPTRITGSMYVCEQALTGKHSVSVTTEREDDLPESVQALEGFTVDEVPIPVERAMGSFYLGLSRVMRDGVISEAVSAYAGFIGVVSSCGSSNGTYCSAQVLPYDTPTYYPPPGCTPSPNTNLFPPGPSFDAGPYVYFEIPGSVRIELVRNKDQDGMIYYVPKDEIPLEAFRFDAKYDIWSEGGTGENTVGAFYAEGVLLTVPSDFVLVEPDLFYAPTLNRYDALLTRWEDLSGNPGANTFPFAAMYTRLRTTDALTGNVSEVRVIPADDGEYIYPAQYVSQLYPGSGRFLLQTSRIGKGFTLPDSTYQSSVSSGVSYEGYFELRE